MIAGNSGLDGAPLAQFPACEFWDFSLAVYGSRGVPAACLALQERYRANVNLLLFCCWLGASGRGALGEAGLTEAQAAAGRWHAEVVRGLRAVRKLLKDAHGRAPGELAEELRKKVAAAELEAEHIEQLLLAGLAPPPAPGAASRSPLERAADAARGAAAYLAGLGAALDGADRDALLALLAGVFPALAGAPLAAVLAALPVPPP